MRFIRRLRAPLSVTNDPRGVPVAPSIRTQQRRRRKQVRVPDPPFLRDPSNRGIIERQQRFPELRVLPPELARGRYIQSVIEQDELWAAAGKSADQDVARVRIAVEPAEEKHLCAEEVDHCFHDIALAQTEAVDVCGFRGAAEALARACGEDGGERCAVGVADPDVAAVWGFEDFALADADAVDPFGDHDAAGGEGVVDLGDVDAVAEGGLGGDEVTHAVGVGGLVEEIGFLAEAGGDVGCEVR